MGTSFVLNQGKNIRMLSKSTNLAEMHRMQKHVHIIFIRSGLGLLPPIFCLFVAEL